MFPNGVIYEGVSEEPLSFRGESGANDSMIPMCDNLLQVRPLTSNLHVIYALTLYLYLYRSRCQKHLSRTS
jgi:hypothetical protein